MFYHLFEYLETLIDLPGSGLFKYISFRAIISAVLAIYLSVIIGRRIIKLLAKLQIGDQVRELGLEGQYSKKGTPTMGGIIIILAILIPTLLFGDLSNVYLQLLIITTVCLGFLGFLDDYIKVFKKDKEGLRPKYKILGQVTLGIIVGTTLLLSEDVVIRDKITTINEDNTKEVVSGPAEKSTSTTIPFIKNQSFEYGDLLPFKGKVKDIGEWVIYIFVIVFVIVAVSNGTNLTDGLDGLATGTSLIVGATLGVLAYLSGNFIYSDYLNIMYIPYTGEITIFMATLTGALLGFLWYNSYPAQVFMGDTGSLALGGIIAVAAIMIRKELLIPILCGIFFVESISVIAQRIYFKYTKKRYGVGRRVFKMAPLHHHFQKPDIDAVFRNPKRAMPEPKIVLRFWIITIILAVVSIVTLKIR